MQAKRVSMLVLCAALTACAESGPGPGDPIGPFDPVRDLTVNEQQVATSSNAFAFDLLQRAHAAETAKPNFMISPLSVSMALGMTLNGAAGTTFDAMRGTLDFGGLAQPEINVAYKGLIGQLHARDPKVEWRLANSIWYDKSFTAFPTFVDTVRHYFDAEVRQLDFASPATPQTINGWVEEKTRGRIKNLIGEIGDEVMFLVNAVYFYAPWTTPFEVRSTRNAPFTTANGNTVNVPMMSGDGRFRSYRSADVTAAELFYADSAYSMVLWMGAVPTQASWNSALAAMHSQMVILSMPKFKFSYEVEMRDLLTAMGMGIAFSPGGANFSRIAPVPPELYITKVNHKAFIEVDERGTEAAAATSVGVAPTSAPMELRFDRPFFFAIRERSSGAILFMGRVGQPGA